MEQSATFRRSVITSNPVTPKPPSQVRPRRLPTLIKVLTGYDDEPYWNVPRSTDRLGRTHVPVIAYIEKPKIEPSQQKRKKRIKSDDTVRIAAAAAATAVWSQSIRSFGSCRMNRVNSEWDAALRWIAGWDSTALSEDTSLNEWANNLVDDLTTALEACIEQCSEGQVFDSIHYTYGGDVDSFGAVDIGSFSIGAFLWRSVFGWSFGKLLRLSELGRLDTTTQIVASTVVVYAVHSLWGSGLDWFIDWFRKLRDRDTSDDWLTQYEKEMETVKSSRTRQKKGKKSKKKQRQWAASKRALVDKKAIKNKTLASMSQDVGTVLAREDASSNVPDDDFVPGDPQNQQSDLVCTDTKSKFVVSKDSIGSSIHDGVPSIISLSSATSVTSSPSMKPRSPSPTNVPENQPLTNHAFNSSVARGGVYSQQLPGRNAFAVPTVEQRNEAANQLRDFQNAQIRRLVLQKQQQQQQNVAQDSWSSQLSGSGSSPALSAPLGVGNVSKQTIKTLKPPPGFSEFTHIRQDQYPSNLDENELLLSKLLDDDDDEVNGKKATLPVSIESSLDPSAAPFFISDEGNKRNCLEPKKNKTQNDQWSGNIKGVYGGSVW